MNLKKLHRSCDALQERTTLIKEIRDMNIEYIFFHQNKIVQVNE